MKRFLLVAVLALFSANMFAGDGDLKLLYWNIQNGMWCGQNDNYDAFVKWVNDQNPDICVWCEAQSNYISNSDKRMAKEDRYLVEGWGELAQRYGHRYWAIGGYRDDFPQVVTSKYPIITKKKIVGNDADSVVMHGSGWFQIEVKGKAINIVTLHTWPHKHILTAKDKKLSAANHEGDKFRRIELEYICKNTIGLLPNSDMGLWMMLGDFNSVSREDNWHYKYPDMDSRFMVHDFIASHTPYIDLINKLYPNQFIPTIKTTRRIDFIYCSPSLFEMVKSAKVIADTYTTPVREPNKLSYFWIPSDHLPIVMEIEEM